MGNGERSTQTQQDVRSNIGLLGLVSLLNDASSEIIQPILPLFISSLGGGAVAIGLIGGLSDGIPSILKVFSGYWADKMGKKKPLVVAGYGLSALSKLLFPLSMIWQQVFILRGLERCGKGIRSAPRDAIIADSATKESRGMGFGILRAMDSTGAVIGSALAYLLWRAGLDFRMIFVIAALLAVLSFVPLLKVRDIIRDPQVGLTLRLSLSSLSPGMKRFMIIASLFALANISYMFFILRAQQFFSGSMAIGAPLLLYLLFNIIYACFAVPSGIISDRIGRKKVLTVGYALFVAVCIGFAAVSSWLGLVALFMLYGLVFAMVDGAQSAFVSDLSRSEARGSALGVYYGAVGFASIFSGIIAGLLWQSQGSQITFIFAAFAATVATIGLLGMRNVEPVA